MLSTDIPLGTYTHKALYHHKEFGDNSLWVRPKIMFLESVRALDGTDMPRFKKNM
jgi:hypothetical protein